MFDFIKKKIKESINSIQKKLVKEEESEEKKLEKREQTNGKAENNLQGRITEITSLKEPVEKPTQKEKPVERQDTKEIEKQPEENNIKRIGEEIPGAEKSKPKTREKIKTEVDKERNKKHHLFSHRISDDDIDGIYNGIREALLENNVAIVVLEAIHKDLRESLVRKEVSFLSNKKEIEGAIKKSIADVMLEYPIEKLISEIRQKKPYTILFVGVNGAGKTTTLAKLIRFFSKQGLKIVVSASDTFRAASIEQLEIHTKKLGAKIIKHNYGADPAAVAFDAIKHAKIDGSDLVLIDTAGRSDINKNLIDELKKIKRVSKPDLTIFIGDALTGNDAVNQAKIFDKEIGIDATILSKADVDKKGGAVISISYVTKKPIMFLGTGQGYDDLVPFDKEKTAEFLLD